MSAAGKIHKLDEVVVNRIAAGEVIQRPANALKELIENSLDAKATSIQIVTKEGGLKLLQIQDNGTGIRKEDMDIVCERFTTSKLRTFDDLQSISTFGFRGEALASMSHVALLTIITKTADEKCAYKASYIDSKLKAPPKPCAGNQGTTIMIENLFYNVATRRKALSNPTEEFNKIVDVVTKYAIHNPTVGFVLKKHSNITPQVRTPHNSTKMSNVRMLYGNPVSRELLEIELDDEAYQFKMHALITNPNYANKRMVLLLFINNRLVDCSSIHKMVEDMYSFYLPKKAHPWCYISLDLNPHNIDVNVHPTKHEVKFLHESTIVERIRFALDEKLSASSASRTFYVQARLPKSDITVETLKAVLPEYETGNAEKSKKMRPQDMIRTDSSEQKLDKFNFTLHTAMKQARIDDNTTDHESVVDNLESHRQELNERADNDAEDIISNNSNSKNPDEVRYLNPNENIPKEPELSQMEKPTTSKETSPWSNIVNETSPSTISEMTTLEDDDIITSTQKEDTKNECSSDSMQEIFEIIDNEFTENTADETIAEQCKDEIADKARKQVYQYFGKNDVGGDKNADSQPSTSGIQTMHDNTKESTESTKVHTEANVSEMSGDKSTTHEFKSYSVNTFRRAVKLTSVLKLRKEVEDNCHEGLKEILSNLTFVGCVDESSALIQSGVNLYFCNTTKLVEELFYEIMLYDFANYGVIKFTEPIPLYDLAMMGLDTEEAGWTEEDGSKEELATNVKELLLEKADMMKEYFSIVIDKKGNLKSLPLILDKYFPSLADLPLYILRLATEVEWSAEQPCFRDICRETAKYYSQLSPMSGTHDWKHITQHVLYEAIRESLLPLKQHAHDSTILQIATLPDLYKVFERC